MNNLYQKSIVLTICIVSSSFSSTNISQQVNDILRYQEQKKIYKKAINKLKEQKKTMYNELSLIKLETSDDNKNKACVEIKKIEFKDITLFSQDVLNNISKPYLNKCQSIKNIRNIVKEINNIYIKNAYITSRAYIVPQSLKKGILLISAMEGKIDRVISDKLSTKMVFPFIQGKNLNLRDIETGIEQLNRLQSYTATMEIKPAKKKGYSIIKIKGKKVSNPLHGSLSINNQGTAKSGKYQINSSLNWDNFFGINDLLTISLNTTSKQDNKNKSLGKTLSYSFPISRTYLSFNYSEFYYNQVVNGLNNKFQSKGDSKNYKFSLEYKLFHSKTKRGKFDFILLRNINNNYIANQYLETSSSKLTSAQIGYTQNYMSKDTKSSITITYHQGLKWFGVKSPAYTTPNFKKITCDATYSKNFFKSNNHFIYNFFLHGQYAKQTILGSEQIGMGGPYSVRGYKSVGSLSGNKGFYIRNELIHNKKTSFGIVKPYLGLDYGQVSKNKSSQGGYIWGSAIGCRIQTKQGFSIELFKSHPLKYSQTKRASGSKHYIAKPEGFFGVNFSYKF